jgi:N-acetylneuraminic acid mutarotase
MLKRLMIAALGSIAALVSAAPAPATDPAPPLPDLPRAVSSFGAAAADGWLYVYGGHCAKTHNYSTEAVLGSFHRLRLSGPAKWEKLPDGPPSQGLALAAHQGKLYRIGGMQPRNAPGDKADNHSLTSCACYDPALGKWTPLPDLPEARSSHDAIVVGDKLVVVGGWNMQGAGKANAWHQTALILDLAKAPLRWESVKQPFRRRALVAADYQGKVYVIGGIGEDAKTVLSVNIFEPETQSWSTGTDLPGPRRNGFSPGACTLDGRLYVTPSDGRVLRLSAKHDAWEEAGELKQSRIVHRMTPGANGTLIVVGGAAGGDNISLTEAVTPRPRGQ